MSTGLKYVEKREEFEDFLWENRKRKNLAIAIVIVLLLLVVVGGYLEFTKSAQPPTPSPRVFSPYSPQVQGVISSADGLNDSLLEIKQVG